ncbi:MAG: antibiotic biosynthesis monooxygenase family protein [Candidatus Promineifilaceae bacterium]|nr:antibiotic biosynthesis monooxygenase family protein [Candidatus Promineifilaceae bacterium]
MLETGQFTVYATFLAQKGKYEQMEAICRESLSLTKTAPGLQQVICLEPPNPEKPFVFVSIWHSKANFQAFLQTPDMREFHSKAAVQKMFDTAMQEATADFYSVMDAWEPAQ